MKTFRIIAAVIAALGLSLAASAQRISDSGYRTTGYIKSDGTVQDSSYRTIGHASGIPMFWAAIYFFFKN